MRQESLEHSATRGVVVKETEKVKSGNLTLMREKWEVPTTKQSQKTLKPPWKKSFTRERRRAAITHTRTDRTMVKMVSVKVTFL